jgi:hypothetical protein
MKASPTDNLVKTLGMVATAAARAQDPWWIIGSAAVALHGGAVGVLRDVDVMMSGRDAEDLLLAAGKEPRKGTSDGRFRSEVFGTWTNPPIPVEVFGGFQLRVDGAWREVSLATREAANAGGATVFVPSRLELVRLLTDFGRPKDLERVRLLGSQSPSI